jgi:hypothetical protein
MSSGAHNFVVSVSEGAGSSVGWNRAMQGDVMHQASTLPEQAEARLKARGLALGEQVNRVLESLGPEYELRAVAWDGASSRWLIRVHNPNGLMEVPLPAELVDGAIGAGSINDLGRLRNLVLFAAGRADLIWQDK